MKLIKYKLSDVAKVEISGVDKKTNEGETKVRLCNFTDVYHNWAITKELESTFMVASANDKELAKFSIKKGQVAFTKDSETRDDIGIPTYIADDFENVVLGYHCALITPDENKVLGSYINAFMHTTFIKKYFENNASGSGQRYTLSIDAMENMPLLLPTLEEQRQITKLLSNLDKKIALNRAINRNLEAIITNITNHWFLSRKNELDKRQIGEVSTIKAGGDCPSVFSPFPKGDFVVPIYSNGMEKEGLYGYTTHSTITGRSITVAARGTIGYCVRRYGQYVPIIRLLSVCPHDAGGDTYLHQVISRMTFNKNGSVQQQLTVPELSMIEVPYPSKDELKKYDKATFPLILQINQNNEETKQLTIIRDELLPLLMNGQMTVNSVRPLSDK